MYTPIHDGTKLQFSSVFAIKQYKGRISHKITLWSSELQQLTFWEVITIVLEKYTTPHLIKAEMKLIRNPT
jgi:hypothetical protein